MAIVLKIDNLDKSNLINFDSLEIQNNLYSKADSCFFTYEKYGSRTYVPAGGQEVGIWDGATKIFGGKITNVRRKIRGKVLIYDVEAKSWLDQLDGLLVAKTYEDQTVNQIITDLKNTYFPTFDITNVSCATNIEAIYFDMKPASKCLDDLAEITGYHWYVDPDKKIYFFVEGSITSPFNITDTNGHCISETLEIEDDYQQIKNRVNILGGSIPNTQVHDDTSIATYGEHEVIIRDNSLTSADEALQKANAVLAAYKDPIKKGGFQTYDAGLCSGQKINVNSTLRGINQDFIIESVIFRARTPTNFYYEVRLMTEQDKGLLDLLQYEITKPPQPVMENFGNKHFSCSVKFSIVNYHKISWEAGQIIMSSGETYSIVAGEREFTNTEICYFRPSVSATTFQFSTTFGDGVGEDRIGLGYAVPNPNTALGAQFIPIGFMGGVRFWGGENIVARTIIADQIGLNALTADLVTTGEFITLTAQIKNAIITNAKINDISADKINAGTINISWVGGSVRSGQTAYNVGTGWWIGNDGGTPKLSVGVSTGNYFTYDGAGVITLKGSITIVGGSGIANLSDAGNLAVKDQASASDLDTTVISGGKIITGLLTADNIQTGTLNASLVTVTNLNAGNITTGILTGIEIRTASSGQRIILSSTLMTFYDASAAQAYIYASGGQLLIAGATSSSNIFLDAGSAAAVSLGRGGSIYSYVGAGYALVANANLNMGSYRIVSLGEPSSSSDAATKNYVDTHAVALSAVSIDTTKSWGSYGITGLGTLTPYSSGGYNLGSTSYYWNYIYTNYLYFNSSYGYILLGGTTYMTFWSASKLSVSFPFGFQVRSGTPGAASSFQGYMYYDTAQTDLVFSNGVNWYKLTATQI